MDDSNDFIYFVLLCALSAIAYSVWIIHRILKAPTGTARMQEIAALIQQGANTFLLRQYGYIGIVGLLIALALLLFFKESIAFAFILGAVTSGFAGYVGMQISVRANVRTAEAARSGVRPALTLAFEAGTVTGMFVVGLGLCVTAGYFFYLQYCGFKLHDIMAKLVALSFGASLISMFARLGGGIFTKGADVGADLVGKIEAGIPEDDARNPAVIADNVGDNVGDCAGMAADVFETYLVTIIATMLLSAVYFDGIEQQQMLMYPLAIAAVCILSTIGGTLAVIFSKTSNIIHAMYRGLGVTAALSIAGFAKITNDVLGFDSIYYLNDREFTGVDIFYVSLIGIFITVALVAVTAYYTSTDFRPVRSIAQASETGHGTNIIQGLAVSLESTAIPALIIITGIITAYHLCGVFGISIAATSMMALAGIIVTLDAYGPVTDNAGGIAEMSDLPPEVRETTDKLDAIGNTTKTITKGYAIGSAGLASLILFATYTEDLKYYFPKLNVTFSLTDPYIVVGLFVGAMLPYLFSSMSMKAVAHAAASVVVEVRRQFSEIIGIMDGKAKPDYHHTVDMLSKTAIREMFLPALLPVAAPVLLYFIVNGLESQTQAFASVGAMLLGVITTGMLLAISMTSGGGAWDNAKKYIEQGHHGGKGSEAHMASITGDTVGDPYKDTAGPAINPMIKICNIVAIMLILLLAKYQ